MRIPSKPKRNMLACDRLGTMEDGLRWKWKWPKWVWDDHCNCWHGGPGYQTASAEKPFDLAGLDMGVTLECVCWSSQNVNYYQAGIHIRGNHVASDPPFTSFGDDAEKYKTRISAQRAAEKLFNDLVLTLMKLRG